MAKLSEKAKQKKSEYNIEYKKKNNKQIKLELNKNTMADVIEQLEKQESKQGYIIDLIRKDIIANKK